MTPWPWLVQVARELELELQISDDLDTRGEGPLTIVRGSTSRRYGARWMSAVQGPDLGMLLTEERSAAVFLAAPRISERAGERLRGAGIDYLDLQGNASVHFGDVLVRVSGCRRALPASLQQDVDLMVERQEPMIDLLTPARAQVVLALLQWPHLAEQPLRALAEVAGVSFGIAQAVVRQLDGRRGRRRELDEALIDAWAAAYPTGLQRRIWHSDHHSDLASWSQQENGEDLTVGGEFAVADLVVPARVTVFVTTLTPQLRRQHRMRPVFGAGPVDGNTTVCHKFWRVPTGASPGEPAPWLMTYAELMAHGDPRLREAAGELRARNRERAA